MAKTRAVVKRNPPPERGWLTSRYIDKKMTAEEISKESGLTPRKIYYWLQKYNIPIRCSKDYSEKHRQTLKKARAILAKDPSFIEKMTTGRMGEKNPNWRGGKWKVEDSFLRKIRNCQRYLDWKDHILKRDVSSYPKIPKNVQVHHLRSLASIVRENNIKTIEDALTCDDLWDIGNGVALTSAEHLIITWMNRMKKHSLGFISYIENFIALNEDRAKEV